MTTFFDDHKVGCFLGIAFTIVFGVAGILASVFSREFRAALGWEEPAAKPGGQTPVSASENASQDQRRQAETAAVSPIVSSEPSRETTLLPTATSSPVQKQAETEPPPAPIKRIYNDIGKTKKDRYYEMTIENAWRSVNPVRTDVCNITVPSGEKAVVVRVAIRWAPSDQPSSSEFFNFGALRPSDFVIMDDQSRTIDPACQNFAILLDQIGQSATTKSLVYLVRMDSHNLVLKFQKSGAGSPITFDLGAVD